MPKFERNLAIIIGINSYQNGISPLQNAVNDAKKLNEILRKKHGYQIWVCLDEIATLENLNKLLEKTLPQEVTPEDRLLFYFAGHGIALNGDDGAEGFLIPQDARLGDTSSYLPMTRLQAALSKLPCRHFLGILDCCFAGAFRWSSSRDLSTVPEVIHQERYDRFISDPAWQVITSADYDQKAADNFSLDSQRGSRGKHSPFAAALIEALTGKADIYPSAKEGKPAGDGVITATELYLYLRDRIEPATEKYRQRQTPSIWPLKKHDKGEYIFLTPGHQLNLPPATPLDKAQNPYRGLESFNQEHSDLFFGRQALTEQLYQFSCQQPLTIVLGASGTGKSSLVKAGLISHLQQLETAENHWHILPPMRPGEFPLKALNKILTQHNSSDSSIINLTTEEKMQVLSGKIEYLLAPDFKTKLLLVVDQTEELFTICRDEPEQQNFLYLLAQLLKKYPQQLHIVLTLRSDFEPQFRNLALEPYWQKARFMVPAMTRDELRTAIEKPAEARVMYFEPHSLVDQLIDEVAQMPGALPLLSFTLSELYLKYLSKVREGIRDKRAITQEDYEEIGGVAQSLTQRADSEYRELVKQEQVYAQTIRHVMLRMIAIGSGELARRRVLLAELEYPEPENGRVKQVIERFSTARLLVEGQDTEGKPYVEPAHDALVRGWQLLAWKQDREESLILQRRLTPAALEWKNLKSQEQLSGFAAKAEPVIDWFDRRLCVAENFFNRINFNKINVQLARLWRRTQNSQLGLREKPEQFLWNGNPYLNVLNETLNSTDNWFNQVEAEFVQQSVLQKRRNTSWRQRIAIAIMLGLSGLSIAALIGQRNAQIGQAIAFRESAEANLRSNQGLDSMILGLRAAKSLKHPVLQLFKPDSQLHEQVRGTLLTAIYQVKEHNRLEGHLTGVRSVSFSPDGQLLATSGEDGTVRLWNLQGQELEKPFRGHRGLVRSVSFSPDGQLLATAGKDGTVRLWNLQGQEVEKIEGHQGEVKSVSFSPDGQLLATAGKDGTVRLWNLQGKNLAELKGNKSSVSKVNFSPDGRLLAIARENGNFSLWNLSNQKLETFSGNQGKLWYVMFSSNGQQLATAGEDGTVRLWNLQGQDLEKFEGHQGPVRSIGFSFDGQQLATAGDDGTVRLWNLPGEELAARKEHRDDPFRSVSYSPNGQRLATAGKDGTVRLWNLQGEELAVGKGHQGEVRSVSYSPNGQQLATAGDDGTVRLWNLQGEQIEKSFQGHTRVIYSVAFSPNGQQLATAGEDETARLWDTEGKQLNKLIGHLGKVYSVAFSPNGQQLATAGEDETARLWDTEGKQLNKLIGHLGKVYSVAFSPDGQQLATAGEDGTVRLWNQKGEQIEKPFQGHKEAVRSVAFSPDGMIVSSGEDDTVRFWNLQGEPLTILSGHQGEIYSVAFSPDGQQLVTAGNNSTAKLWEIKSFDESIKSACVWAWNYLKHNSNVSESDRHLCDPPVTSFPSLNFTPNTLHIK
jgi:WD40 repeat protein